MAETDFDKTEPATPRRREEARQEGNVARSADLTAAIMLLGAILLLHVMGLKVMTGMKLSLAAMLRQDFSANPARADDVPAVLAYGMNMTTQVLGPFLLALAAVGLVAAAGQVGVRLTPQALRLDLTKLSPLRGLQHMLDTRGRIRVVMSAAKMVVVFGVVAWWVWDDLPRIVVLAELPMLGAFALVCQMVYELALKLAVILLIMAALDYAYQRWQRERDLRMTKEEVKEEFKRMEGDPQIKQRRTRVARQLALQRIHAAVPRAQVVVTNPTHFAIALQYDAGRMKAPRVAAKGADLLAARIRQLAALHGIPIVERKELARALYASVEVNQEIPPQFYNAVAEVLAYVYRLAGRKSA